MNGRRAAGSRTRVGADVTASMWLSALLVLAGLAIDDGTVGLLIGFIVFGLCVYAMTRVPIRDSLMVLIFFAMALPNPGEGQPTKWDPPFNIVGAALLNHLNTVDRQGFPLSMIPVSAMEIFFLVLFLVRLQRKASRSRIDGEVPPTPRPLVQLAYLALATALFTWFSGLVRGGDFGKSLWQLNAVIYLPIIFLLFQTSFRGPQDLWSLAKVYLAAAFYKCCLAVYVFSAIKVPMDPYTGSTRPAYATAHADSMLFAVAVVIVIVMVTERVHRKAKWLAAFMFPILMAGTLANNRRLAWVQMGIVCILLYIVSRETRLKVFIRRALTIAVPIGLLYVAAGWNSTYGRLFRPVRMMRSVIDAESDGSSRWREWENVNIIATFRNNPIFGSGYGHPFEEVIVLPTVDYDLEAYIPHNSLLGQWGYMGLIGVLGITLFWTAGVYFAVRVYRYSSDPRHRAAGLICFGAVPIYLAQAWGDLGLGTWTGVFMMAASITAAGKLAVVTGQWSEAVRRPKAAARFNATAPSYPSGFAPGEARRVD